MNNGITQRLHEDSQPKMKPEISLSYWSATCGRGLPKQLCVAMQEGNAIKYINKFSRGIMKQKMEDNFTAGRTNTFK